jgi:ABC-type sugar transport system permease subunit
MKRKISDAKFAWLIISPAIIVVFGIVLFPLIQTFLYSIKDTDLSIGNPGNYVGLSNYVSTLTDQDFWFAAGRTAYFAGVSIGIELILGLFIALLLNENFRGKVFLQSIIIIPWAIPTIVNGAMWKWIYHSEYGALNALLTQLHIIDQYRSWLNSPWLAMNMVIIADIWKMTPLVVIFLLASLQMVNKSVYEAADVDGAGMIKRLFILTLPYLKPTILVIIVIRTMETFKVFDIIYAITQGGPANGTMVLTYQAYIKAFSGLQYSEGATISYLIAMIIALLTFTYVRTMKKGEMI